MTGQMQFRITGIYDIDYEAGSARFTLLNEDSNTTTEHTVAWEWAWPEIDPLTKEDRMSLEDKYGKRPDTAPSQYRSVPQVIANEMEEATKEALMWTPEQGPFLGDPSYEISDEEVEERITSWHFGYMREYLRTIRPEEPHYLPTLPMEIKRALVERWNRIFFGWLDSHPDVDYDYVERRFFFKETGTSYVDATAYGWPAGAWNLGEQGGTPTTTSAEPADAQRAEE